eukprot:2501186-Alexandrium_andersonii.AAC.1
MRFNSNTNSTSHANTLSTSPPQRHCQPHTNTYTSAPTSPPPTTPTTTPVPSHARPPKPTAKSAPF